MVQSTLKNGAEGRITFTVEAKHAIDFADNGMPAVLSTPWLIWFMEHSAREAVLPYLDEGESTVGVKVDIEHLAPTPLGHQVICRSHVTQRQGYSVWFRLEAHDEHEQIARGFHEMRIIKVDRFAQRIERKKL